MLRLLVSPKWVAWHVLTLGAMVTCAFLAAWQWNRAGSALGSALNIGYGVQWPIFAVFFGVMWWRFLRMEIRDLGRVSDGSGSGVAPEVVGSSAADASPGEAIRRKAIADGLPSAADAEPPNVVPTQAPFADPPAVVPLRAPSTGPQRPAPPERADDRPSPFTPRPAGIGPSRLSDPQIRAYNEALADLAAREREN